jgi:hypothetical protein
MNTDNDDDVAQEVEDTPSWVKEGTAEDDAVFEGEDIHAAEQFEGSDVIEPAKGVEMFIKSVRLNVYTPEGKTDWKVARLEPMLVIGSKGVDGKGKYKNKHFFPSMICAVNRQSKEYDFSVNAKGKETKYWQPNGGAFGDYNAFLTALGFPTNPAPRNDAAFRRSLVNRSIIVDITKDRRQVEDKTAGKWVYTDEHENKLLYRGAPKAAAKTDVVEAAAS